VEELLSLYLSVADDCISSLVGGQGLLSGTDLGPTDTEGVNLRENEWLAIRLCPSAAWYNILGEKQKALHTGFLSVYSTVEVTCLPVK
jgi:hypothetical protein